MLPSALLVAAVTTIKGRTGVTSTLDEEELALDQDQQALNKRTSTALRTRIHLLYALGVLKKPDVRKCARARAPSAYGAYERLQTRQRSVCLAVRIALHRHSTVFSTAGLFAENSKATLTSNASKQRKAVMFAAKVRRRAAR